MHSFSATRVAACCCALLFSIFTVTTFGADHTDTNSIAAVMKSTWDRPDAPLSVEPVVVSGDYALAGWAQGDRGGRALLRRQHGAWSVYLCGGDDLRSASALEQGGVPKRNAADLAALLKAAESRTSPVLLRKFSLFEGIVKVDGDPAHATHGAHAAHGAHAISAK